MWFIITLIFLIIFLLTILAIYLLTGRGTEINIRIEEGDK